MALRKVHNASPTTRDFCPFPDNLTSTSCPAHDHPACAAFQSADFGPTPFADAVTALKTIALHAHWRETYKDTDIGQDFLDRFGCFCLIGPNAPWTSQKMHGFLVFVPPDLWYPWHHHVAEELYFVFAGSGTFRLHGQNDRQLGPGDAIFHGANQPHALQTTDHPVLAWELWRADFDTPPTLTSIDKSDHTTQNSRETPT